jgi:hypothetical protein
MGLDMTLRRLLKIGANPFQSYGCFLWRGKPGSLFHDQEVLMKIAQFFHEGVMRLGVVQGDQLLPLAFQGDMKDLFEAVVKGRPPLDRFPSARRSLRLR